MGVKMISQEILKNVGGRSNIRTLDRCATRLRFYLHSLNGVNSDAIKSLEGGLGVEIIDGQYQIIIGAQVQDIYRELVKDTKIQAKKSAEEPVYNNAKVWQLILFPMNNTATNCFMWLMGYVSYLAVGALGVGTVVISSLITMMRIWDGITDPVIGFLIDKTSTKIGKFRPMIVIGYVLMVITVFLMYFVAPTLAPAIRFPFFVVVYVFYIIGYTFQTACTKSGQTCITNNPKQRPIFTRCDSIYFVLLIALTGVYVSNCLVPKYGDLTVAALQEFGFTTIVVAGIFTLCAIAALWSKDVPENWGLGNQSKQVKFKDYWSVLKGNKAIQMLIVAASVSKLSTTIATNSSINICLFGLVMGNYALYGSMSMITLIPSILLIFFGTEIARKTSSKKAMIDFTWYSMIVQVFIFALLFFFDPTTISLDNLGFTTIAFILLWCLKQGVNTITGNIVIPMIADASDYETYLSGRYVPGMMGTLFSFIDKIVSSFATTIVGFLLAFAGYANTLPQATDGIATRGSTMFWVTMVAVIAIPLLGWIFSLFALKAYPLDKKKMEEVQAHIQKLKAENEG